MASAKPKRNELVDLVSLSLVVCRRHMSDYSCPKSKRTFTQAQLMTCLVLRARLNLSYRGTVALLACADGLRAAMGLETVPAHATLKMFADRCATPELLDGIVGQVLALCRERGVPEVQDAAVDSTGVTCCPPSRHYEMRTGRKRGRYVKLMVAVACGSILAISATASMGPSNDTADCWGVLWRLSGRCSPHSVYLDGGFDGERVHGFFRDGSVRTRHRSKCVRLPPTYGRRWHAESFFSGMKRVCGEAVRARTEPAMCREALLKVLAYSAFR